MPPTTTPRPAKPTKSIFDPFNSSATGHQRADNRLSGSTSWRDSRSLKLQNQFSSNAGGGERVSDTVGAGSLDFGQDGRTESGGWVKGAKGLRTDGQQSIWESMPVTKIEKEETERPAKRKRIDEDALKPTRVVNPFTPFRKEDGSIRETSWTSHEASPSTLLSPLDQSEAVQVTPPATPRDDQEAAPENKQSPQIFANLGFYINGSTAPMISDHKLKHMISSHGGRVSVALGRRSVTHVIIGRPSSNGGSGGGLSGTKIQKQVARKGGIAINFVTAEWVLESIKARKRLPESRFEAMKLAPKGISSVASMFGARQRSIGGSVKGDG